MIIEWVTSLGPWSWMVFGAVLLAIEILAPGVYLLWLGIAAIITGALSFWLSDTSFWLWQTQIVAFLILSVASTLAGRRYFPATDSGGTDEPLLNLRSHQLVGRTALLEEPIHEGRGRIRIDDTLWRVNGPNLPAGTRVRVISASGNELTVAAE